MSKATIYGKKTGEVLKTIYDVEEYFSVNNGIFYIRTKEQEYYLDMYMIGAIHIDAESEEEI